MAFQSAQTLVKTTRTHTEGDVILSTDRQNPRKGQADDEPRYVLRLSIDPEAAEKAGLRAGDRVDLLVDAVARRCKLRRVVSGGWKLSQSASSGTVRKLNLKIRLVKGLPSVAQSSACPDVDLVMDGIEFSVPDAASFTENMRLAVERRHAA